MDGETAVAAVLAARMGRWALHDQAHIFGVHLSTDGGRHRRLLARAVERHGWRAAITAVHMLGGAKDAGIGRPYMTGVGWALRLTHKSVFLTVFARALADWLMRVGGRPCEGGDDDLGLGTVVRIGSPGVWEME